MKNRICILLIFLLAGMFLRAQDSLLYHYLNTASQNNPEVKARFYEYRAALEKIPQAGTLPDPKLAFGYFISPVETRNGPQNAKISLTQMFPWFGTLDAKKAVAASRAKAKYEAFEDAKSKLFFDVKAVYYDLYFIRKNIAIIRENIELLKTFKRLALIKIESGKSSAVDALRIAMEMNDMTNKLALWRDKWLVNVVKFNHLLNLDEQDSIAVPERLREDDFLLSKEAALDSIAHFNHRLKRLDFLQESFVNQEEWSRRQGYPDVLLGLDYAAIGRSGASPSAGRDALMLKVGISIPLYRKKYAAMVQEAKFNQLAAKEKQHNASHLVSDLLEKTFAGYEDAVRRIALYHEQTELANRTIKLLEDEYANSGKSFEEILRMQRKVLQYEVALEKARTDKQAAIAFMEFLMGN